MKANRRIIEAIFFGAASLKDLRERAAYLDAACAGDSRLRADVEAMLAAQDDAERFFGENDSESDPFTRGEADQPDASQLPDVPVFDERAGEWVGRYKLLEKLGEGGWGTVYLAEQQEPIIRRVALKVIRLGMDTRTVIARFEAERQALALMDHPNIARVLDVGSTTRGRPFFVMELVAGTPITEFCRAQHLPLRHRLELFVQVCHAVQHAHQKGIIHRDLKPSNILVTVHDGVRVPKVIDFGIAQAVAGNGHGRSRAGLTEPVLGTPAYMSPEQMQPGPADVDTRSDIYSLGVVLYELLTGRTPFDGKELMRSGGVEAMRRILVERQPERPSAAAASRSQTGELISPDFDATEQTKLITELKSDLDWIILKALAKDCAHRYESVSGLASDVIRYLNDQPVVARPAGRLYRFRKLVRRNRLVFAAGGTVALALVVGLSVAIGMYFKAHRAEQQQARLRQIAEAARANETELRIQAEAREKLTEAVILVGQGNHEEAVRRLGQMKVPPSQPTLDGIAALRAVSGWLAVHGRWRESADYFTTLLKIDELDDWKAVTWDYQGCGAVLAETGDLEAYALFRESALKRFSATTNGVVAGRILNACLLLPPPAEVFESCRPLGDCVEEWSASLNSEELSGWSAIPGSLWNYRRGRYDAALVGSRNALNLPGRFSAHTVALQAIAAMSLEKSRRREEAVVLLKQARHGVESSFQRGIERGNATFGYWPDWIFSRQLVREASALIESGEQQSR